MMLWLFLFGLSAALHSAESAITKISPWKVQQFAEEEGPRSPFATLSNDITRLLITILLTTTACSIYSTALFVATMSELFPALSLGSITAALTIITLFFGELIPKAVAVSNSELVARKLVPTISRISMILSPFTAAVTLLSDYLLQWAGLRSKEDRNVSEDMLRMVVDEAQRTEGIELGEGRMIKAVLDIQDKEVSKVMQPRVDIVAVPESATATEILHTVLETKYSRIPVYRGGIDNIVGIVFSKDLLDYMQEPVVVQTPDEPITPENASFRPQMMEKWSTLTAAHIMERNMYYIPETMSCWNALQAMRKQRLHMAIVVDEFGGTSGLVTFEDILEEVVGEIYDEDDVEEEAEDSGTIYKVQDSEYGHEVFKIKGYAELDDVFEALGVELDDEEEEESNVGDINTIGGLLCSVAGMIPRSGDQIEFADFNFIVNEVEDNRRIISLTAVPLDRSNGSNGSITHGSMEGMNDGYKRNETSEDLIESTAETISKFI